MFHKPGPEAHSNLFRGVSNWSCASWLPSVDGKWFGSRLQRQAHKAVQSSRMLSSHLFLFCLVPVNISIQDKMWIAFIVHANNIQSWSPYLRKDIQCLEGVHKAATKLIPALRKLDYGQRLQKLGLTTMETRRRRGDLIKTFKIMTGKEKLSSEQYFISVLDTRPEATAWRLQNSAPDSTL